MSLTFFKWIQYLERREISKFIGLYSTKCIIIPRLECDKTKNSLILPYSEESVLHNTVGVFKNFENILLSKHREFKITDHSLTVNQTTKNHTIYGNCKFLYKDYSFNSNHNMTLSKENDDWKIVYHLTTLKRINKL